MIWKGKKCIFPLDIAWCNSSDVSPVLNLVQGAVLLGMLSPPYFLPDTKGHRFIICKKHHLTNLHSLAVALGCRTNTTLHITDQLPMYELMKQNITLNNLDSKVSATIYDWGAPTPSGLPAHPDVILAADCVYFEPAFPLLQETLKDLIGENTVCYFCFKKRRRADLQFMKVAKKMFDVKEVEDDPDKEVYSRQSLFL